MILFTYIYQTIQEMAWMLLLLISEDCGMGKERMKFELEIFQILP